MSFYIIRGGLSAAVLAGFVQLSCLRADSLVSHCGSDAPPGDPFLNCLYSNVMKSSRLRFAFDVHSPPVVLHLVFSLQELWELVIVPLSTQAQIVECAEMQVFIRFGSMPSFTFPLRLQAMFNARLN